MRKMKINKTNALHLWNQSFGNAEYVEDFHGNLMCRNAYGDKKYFITDHKKRIYCGWNVHHILPVSHGGTNAGSNLICTNIATNDAAEDKITFWIDESLYQVQRKYGTSEHEIVKLN